MNTSLRLKLSVMMFLQFLVWGAWYVTGPSYLGSIGFGAEDFKWMYSVGPIAAMISPFFVGMIADRFFAGQRVLGTLHLLGAGFMLIAAFMMKGGSSPGAINFMFFLYVLTYFPTLALVNTVAMRNIDDPEKQFPGIRVLGTIGWIAAGLTLSWLGWSTKINMFYLTVGAALALGLFSFLLPHTPPNATGRVSAREILGLDALVLLKDRSYLVFIICSMLICIPLAFYYQIAARVVEMMEFHKVGGLTDVAQAIGLGDAIGLVMSFGQMSEIIFMLVIPFFFARLGVKWMLGIGMLAWVIRYLLFSLGAPEEVRWMILVGVVLHGICYDFFFVTGQIYTDNKAPRHLRGQAQGLLVLFTLGLGMLIGAQIAGQLEARFTPEESNEYGAQVAATMEEIQAVSAEMTTAGTEAERTAWSERLAALEAERAELRKAQLLAIDWRLLWGIPAGFAAVVLVVFMILFRDVRSEPVEVTAAEAAPDSAG